MTKYIQIKSFSRIIADGEIEQLIFSNGVNVITGKPNAGKSTWLKQIDFLLGKNKNIREAFTDEELSRKYVELTGIFNINGEEVTISRKPLAQGLSSKVFIDDISVNASEFSSLILERLKFPNDLKFPKANPYNSQWVELSFRSVLRHIYRRENTWNDIADQQYPNEQYAAQFQLFGIAKEIYSKEFDRSVSNVNKLTILEAQKNQYTSILNRFAQEMAPKGEEILYYANESSINSRINFLESELVNIEKERNEIIENNINQGEEDTKRFVQKENELLSRKRSVITGLQLSKETISKTEKRIKEFTSLSESIEDELLKLKRAKKAGIISDLKITVCPACDQNLPTSHSNNSSKCFLCHQPTIEEDKLPKQSRIEFEIKQLESQFKEIKEIIEELKKEVEISSDSEKYLREQLFYIEKEIEPIKNPFYSLIHPEISELDVRRGIIQEQIQNYNRLLVNLEYKDDLLKQIQELESQIQAEKNNQEFINSKIDFIKIAQDLEDGMQYYVDKIADEQKEVWSHRGRITVAINESKVAFYVNNKPWASLGGRDKEFFLLSYHFGLLTLTGRRHYQYPGLVIIDLPPVLGDVKENSFNYLVNPFIKYCEVLLKRKPLQVIFAGRAFEGINGANIINLETSWQ